MTKGNNFFSGHKRAAAHMNSQQWRLHAQDLHKVKSERLNSSMEWGSRPQVPPLLRWPLATEKQWEKESKFSLVVKPLMGWLCSNENHKFKNIWE